MVNQSLLKTFEFDSIEDYFQYIIDSKTNGQHTQARQLFKQLSPDDGMQSKGQRSEFFEWAEATYYYDAQDSDEMDELGMLRDYFKNSK
jgi:hypothetical protein